MLCSFHLLTFPFTSAKCRQWESRQWTACRFAHLTSTSTPTYSRALSRGLEQDVPLQRRTRRKTERLGEWCRRGERAENGGGELQWGWQMKGWEWGGGEEEREILQGALWGEPANLVKGEVAKFRLWKGNFFFFWRFTYFNGVCQRNRERTQTACWA